MKQQIFYDRFEFEFFVKENFKIDLYNEINNCAGKLEANRKTLIVFSIKNYPELVKYFGNSEINICYDW